MDLVTRIELRCPIGARKLLAAMVRMGEQVKVDKQTNLMELVCRDCRDYVEKQEGRRPSRVLHYYNILGEHVDDLIVWPEVKKELSKADNTVESNFIH